MEEITMKMKKILAACAASVTALSMMAFSASAQGATDDSDVIDPTPVVEETTAAPVEETAVVTTEASAPVAPVTNPTTGNAPVALAVIPVALAAAAIVAKKRG